MCSSVAQFLQDRWVNHVMCSEEVHSALELVRGRQRLPRLRPVIVSVVVLIQVALFHSVEVPAKLRDHLGCRCHTCPLLPLLYLLRQQLKCASVAERDLVGLRQRLLVVLLTQCSSL